MHDCSGPPLRLDTPTVVNVDKHIEAEKLRYEQDLRNLWISTYTASIRAGLSVSSCDNSYSKTAEVQAAMAIENFSKIFKCPK